MIITTRVHTILMLVGPTECGKSTFAREVLMPQLTRTDEARRIRTNVQLISSDDIRQELLGYPYDKYDQTMLEVSSHAFDHLLAKLRLVTSYPINAEFVIVDTTALAEDFRQRVREIAEANHYRLELVLFDYRKREDYYASDRSKRLITSHINRLRREVLPVLAREGYDAVHKVRAKDFCPPGETGANPDYRVEVADWDDYVAATLPHTHSYIVVGDVHECVGELQRLLSGFGFDIEEGRMTTGPKAKGKQVVLAGDWIDKGKQTAATVAFLYANREHFRFVLGNHENFVRRYLEGGIQGADPELVETYFDSIAVLQEQPELAEQFRMLVASAQPYYRFIGDQGSSFYVTHAPCRSRYIGKLDTEARRHQRTYRIDRETPLEPQLQFIQDEAVANQPYHLFGHVAAARAFRIKNKLHLDSGCVHGYALCGVDMSGRPFFRSVRSEQEARREELPVLFEEAPRVALAELAPEAQRRLDYVARHGINHISGTMSPADKDAERGELESLRQGLAYFAKRGVREVVLQPKYMGSRCTIYLHRQPEQCYAVSRNGYRIQGVELTPVYERLLARFGSYMAEESVAIMLLDGELLPWRAMGEGLIERQFEPISRALELELQFLEQSGFEAALGRLAADYEASGFEQEQHRMSKGALSDKYGSATYQSYKAMRDIRERKVPLAQHRAAYEVYRQQLALYAGEAALDYKPFGLLKEVMEDGTERFPEQRTSELYRFLSEDDCLVLDLEARDHLAQAERFYARLTTAERMEGVVIKPEREMRGAVPYMKVRNPEYLSIIYGYDYTFPHKYAQLIKQKSIGSKLRASAAEHRLGRAMLAIPLADISPGNEAYRQTVASLLFEEAKERELDPRL